MSALASLLADVHTARVRVLDAVRGLTVEQGADRPGPGQWNVQEVLEHLVLAERGGYDLIRTAAERWRAGDPVWSGDSENAGQAIEQVIERTWKPRETAPESATPTGRWSAGIWAAHLSSCDALLSDLPAVLAGLPLERVIYPHFLCGPLDVVQRLEFLRFHLERHAEQVRRIRAALGA
jgi:hypothetical protein